jgi:hypothetical protein
MSSFQCQDWLGKFMVVVQLLWDEDTIFQVTHVLTSYVQLRHEINGAVVDKIVGKYYFCTICSRRKEIRRTSG